MAGPLQYKGTVVFGELDALFPRQVQPALSLPDQLASLSPIHGSDNIQLEYDRYANCVHTKELLVPWNQRVTAGGITVLDNNTYSKSGLPSILWNTMSLSTPAPKVQCFAMRPWFSQYLNFQAQDDTQAEVQSMSVTMSTTQIRRSDNTTVESLDTQGFRCLISRSCFASQDNVTRAYIDLRFTIAGHIFSIYITNALKAQVRVSRDGGTNFKDLKELRSSSITKLMGEAGPGRLEEGIEFRVKAINGYLQIGIGTDIEPFVLNIQEYLATSIYSILDDTRIKVFKGTAINFAESTTSAVVWPHGQGLKSTNRVNVTVSSVDEVNDIIHVTDTDDISPGWNFAVIEPRITKIELRAAVFSELGVAVMPLLWAREGIMRSIYHQADFVPNIATPVFYQAHTGLESKILASGQTWVLLYPRANTNNIYPEVEITTVSESTTAPRYDLYINNGEGLTDGTDTFGDEAYTDFTGWMSRVTTRIESIETPATNSAVAIQIGWSGHPIKEIVETIAFNPESLTIDHTCDVTASNFHGIDYTGYELGIIGRGNIAMGMSLGYAHHPNWGGVWQGFRRFWGIVNRYSYTRTGAGMAYVTMHGRDQMYQLEKTFFFAPPDMDFWNHYYAVFHCLQKAGIPSTQMAFLDHVPADPYAPSPTLPYGEEDYMLPAGFGGIPWTPVNRSLPILTMLDYIRKATGYLLYQDAYGYFRYERFIPANPAFPKRIFLETAQPGYAGIYTGLDISGCPPECWNMHLTASTEDTRNQVVLIGLNPDAEGSPFFLEKREDAPSIAGPWPHPINYVGWRQPFVWMDARFANRGFAARTADKLFRLMRQPQYQCHLQCWMQPDLFPLDVIYVDDPKSNSYGVPFYVMSITNKLSIIGEQNYEMSCTVSGMYFDAYAIAP